VSNGSSRDDLIALRKEMALTQNQMANELDMALRSYQSLEAGESEYRPIHRLAAERVALSIAASRKAPMLVPRSVRDDAIELVRVGLSTGDPPFQRARAPSDGGSIDHPEDRDNRFRDSYRVVGELVLLMTALDHQLNHVLIQLLHLSESPMLEAVIATLDTVRKIEMVKERSKYISQTSWQRPVLAYVDKLERVCKWRNIACHTPLIPDDKHGAAFAPTAAAKLLKSLKLGKDEVQSRIPVSELQSAITLAESALPDGLNLIGNFQRANAERRNRFE
jgi:DNA-binding XRE family transcriptional regulator